jgi:hypothetical protein
VEEQTFVTLNHAVGIVAGDIECLLFGREYARIVVPLICSVHANNGIWRVIRTSELTGIKDRE